jgi:tetratricopeptide (TPR) repeat protein
MSQTPTTAPAAKRRVLLLIVGVALALAASYFGLRAWDRIATRNAAIAAAEQKPANEALPELLRCLEREPQNAELLRAIVATHIKAGSPVTDVEPFAERWCRVAPQDANAYLAHADTLRRLSRFPEAITATERAKQLQPGDTKTQSQLANLYLTVGRFADAAREYRELLGPQYEGQDWMLALIRAEWELGNYPEAARLAELQLSRTPKNAGALLLRGLIHYRANEWDAAVSVFNRVTPGSIQERTTLLYHRAQSFDRLGKHENAKTDYAELARIENATRFANDAAQRPTDSALQLRAAEAWLAAEQPDAARKVLEAAISRNGPTRTALELLATCYDKLGRPELATQARTRAATAP